MKKTTKTAHPRARARDVELALRKLIRPDKAEFLPGFFRAIPGGYGEGDQFLGVIVPDQRKIAKQFYELTIDELRKLLHSPWHECRLTAIFILVNRFEVALRKHQKLGQLSIAEKSEEETPQDWLEFFLSNLEGINNWDLVDSAAYKILGAYLVEFPKQKKILNQLARTGNLWQERIAVVATLALIKHDEFDEILQLAKRFLRHRHDLMHKAVGWMLREMGKRNVEVLRGFLSEHAVEMPRTMLRYSIEKLSRSERDKWLAVEHEG